MGSRPPPLLGVLLLGASLVALGTLLWWWGAEEAPAATDANVDVRITDRTGSLLFNATNLRLESSDATVLGALLKAAEAGNFTVKVTYGYFDHAFVTSIHDIENEGACGWVWDRNGVLGDRAADAQRVETGDEVHWHWGCEP